MEDRQLLLLNIIFGKFCEVYFIVVIEPLPDLTFFVILLVVSVFFIVLGVFTNPLKKLLLSG